MPTQPGAFRIKWGKLTIALIGVLALVAVPVTFVLAMVTSLSLLSPLVCLVLTLVCFAALRAGSVLSRRKAAWERAGAALPVQEEQQTQEETVEEAAESQQATRAQQAEASAEAAQEKAAAASLAAAERERVEDVPFDVLAPASTESATTAAQERSTATGEGTEVDDKSAAVADDVAPVADAAKPEAPAAPKRPTTWEPREVPAPTYLAAEKAERTLPAPQPQGSDKHATEVTSIRRAEAERLAAERAERLDLDAVLQRRRA